MSQTKEQLQYLKDSKLFQLKRKVNTENASLRNHLLSIIQDSEIVSQVKDILDENFVLFANM